MAPATREAVEAPSVEALIGLLDVVDGDPELEDGDSDAASEDEGWGQTCVRVGL